MLLLDFVDSEAIISMLILAFMYFFLLGYAIGHCVAGLIWRRKK